MKGLLARWFQLGRRRCHRRRRLQVNKTRTKGLGVGGRKRARKESSKEGQRGDRYGSIKSFATR